MESLKGWGEVGCASVSLRGPALRLGRVKGTHVVARGIVLSACLDAIGQEAQDGANPQQDREAPEELAAELDPLGGGRRWCECVRPVAGQDLLGFAVGQTLRDTGLTQNPPGATLAPPTVHKLPQAPRGPGFPSPPPLGPSRPHLHAVRVVFPADLFH